MEYFLLLRFSSVRFILSRRVPPILGLTPHFQSHLPQICQSCAFFLIFQTLTTTQSPFHSFSFSLNILYITKTLLKLRLPWSSSPSTLFPSHHHISYKISSDPSPDVTTDLGLIDDQPCYSIATRPIFLIVIFFLYLSSTITIPKLSSQLPC